MAVMIYRTPDRGAQEKRGPAKKGHGRANVRFPGLSLKGGHKTGNLIFEETRE